MKISDFKKIINVVNEKTKDIDPSHVYIEFTWWTQKYKPLVYIDLDKYIQSYVLIFGETECNKTSNNEPCNFYLKTDSEYANMCIQYPWTLEHLNAFLMADRPSLGLENIEFMLCSDDIPLNCTVEINPFKTQLLVKDDNTAILTFYASDGGAESKKSMKYFNETSIKRYISLKSNCEQTIIGENNK